MKILKNKTLVPSGLPSNSLWILSSMTSPGAIPRSKLRVLSQPADSRKVQQHSQAAPDRFCSVCQAGQLQAHPPSAQAVVGSGARRAGRAVRGGWRLVKRALGTAGGSAAAENGDRFCK